MVAATFIVSTWAIKYREEMQLVSLVARVDILKVFPWVGEEFVEESD